MAGQKGKSGGYRPGSGRKGWRIQATLGEQEFIFDVGRKNEAESVKRFAEMVGYSVKVEKVKADAIIL